MERVFLYDCTLRDGTQGVGVALALADKLDITRRLDDFGVDYIEGGWPGSDPKDLEFFRTAAAMRLLHARLAAFGSTCRAGVAAADDPNLRALLAAETPVVTVFGKSWNLHVRSALGVTLQENLRMIGDSVSHLKAQGREVIYDAEHFDGAVADGDYALATVRAAAGADWIVLCDTNGGTLPTVVADRTAHVRVFVRACVDDGPCWSTVGVSTNIVEACWLALKDSIEFTLLRRANGLRGKCLVRRRAARPAGAGRTAGSLQRAIDRARDAKRAGCHASSMSTDGPMALHMPTEPQRRAHRRDRRD